MLRHEIGFALGAVRALFGIVPFSAILGFLTPMLVDHWSGGDPDRGGRAYAVNVVGAILGPLLAGFWVLPWLGERWGLCLMSLPLCFIGFSMNWRGETAMAKSQSALPSRVVFACGVLLSVPLVAMTRGFGENDPNSPWRK